MPTVTINVVEKKAFGGRPVMMRWEATIGEKFQVGMYNPAEKFYKMFPTVNVLIRHVVEVIEFDGLALFDSELDDFVLFNRTTIHVIGYPH